jgi:hypothetical protein
MLHAWWCEEVAPYLADGSGLRRKELFDVATILVRKGLCAGASEGALARHVARLRIDHGAGAPDSEPSPSEWSIAAFIVGVRNKSEAEQARRLKNDSSPIVEALVAAAEQADGTDA